jgi:hypothetical protein
LLLVAGVECGMGRGSQLAGAGVAVVWVFRHAAFDDLIEASRDLRASLTRPRDRPGPVRHTLAASTSS